MKYDDAGWHTGTELPQDLPLEDGATHIGMFVAWALQHGLGSERHTRKNAEAVGAVQARRLTGRQFVLDHCAGTLTDADLNARGNAFALAYYEKGYVADWQAFSQARGYASDYHAPDTWAVLDDVARLLDHRLDEWERGATDYPPLPEALLRKRRWWQRPG